jgi:flagellar hook-basal body protein
MSSYVLEAGLRNTQEALTARGANLTKSRTPGDKGEEVQFLPGIGGTSAGGSAASVRIQQRISAHGAITATGNETDFAIDGDGMLIVEKDGATSLTTLTSFRYEENTRTLTNGAGGKLQVVELVNGKLPQNYNSVNSLVSASFRNLSSSAEATKNLLIAANLDAKGDLMNGPGSVINYTIAGAANERTRDSIITPGENAQGAMYIGDAISLQSRVPGALAAATPDKFQFGGIAISRKPTAGSPIYTATDVTGRFSVSGIGSPAATPTQLANGQGMSITTGGAVYNFTATADSNQEQNGQFNSLQSLSAAINATTGGQVRANIGSDGRLYIAAKDADSSITFADIGGGRSSFTTILGLDNIGSNNPAATRYQRYASLLELSKKINIIPTLSAKFEGNNLRFGSASATSSLTVNGESTKERTFQIVTSGYQPAAGDATDSIKRRTVSITSPAHGLKTGDWVRLNGAGLLVGPVGGAVPNALQNGVYRVDFVTDDTFAVATRMPLVAHGAAAGNPPAVDTPMMAPLAAGATPTCTWQKVEGYTESMTTPLGHTTVSRPAAVDVAGYADIRITLGAATVARSNIVVNSTVYITGSALINDGYYHVVAAGGGGVIDIRAMSADDLPNQPPEVALALRAGVGAGGGVGPIDDHNLRMVAVSAPVGGDINTAPLVLGAADTQDITINVPNNGHNYSAGDVIIFKNLASDNVEYGGLRITQDKAYAIKSKTATSITFEADQIVPGTGIAVAQAGHFIGFGSNYDNAGVAVPGALAAGVSNNLGANARIEYVGAAFKAMGINADVNYFTNALSPTYDGGSPAKNFSAGTAVPSYTISTHVFDTFGIEHPVNISFGNMSEKVAAVEIWLPQNDQGVYDIDSDIAGTGQIAYGNITFDGDGHIIGVDQKLQKLNFQWNNGAEPTTIQMDWGAVNGVSLIDGKQAKPGLTKLSGPNHEKFIEPDGNSAGNVVGYKYAKNGVITAVFNNGLTRDVYQVLIGTVANYDGLKHQGGGLYVPIPSESGQILLQIAGTAGAGSFVSGALESSTVNASAEILESTGIANLAKMLYHQVSTQKAVDDYALQKL